jgi:hypothetical protein
MKITDLQLNESLTQEGMWDSLKGKLARTLARPMRQRQEPVMTAEPAPAVWKNARNPGAPAATSPQAAAPVPVKQQPVEPPAVWKNARNPGAPAATSPQAAAPSTAPADVEPEEPAAAPATASNIPKIQPATPDFSKALMGQNAGYGKVTMNAPTGASMNIPKATPGASVPGAKPTAPAAAVEPAAAVNTRPKGSGFLTRLGQEFRGRAQQNQVNAANKEMVNARVNAWKQASQGLDPNNTQAYQTALKTWAQKNFPSADPAVIDQAAASVTPTGLGSNSQQVQAITDIFNNHITNKQIGKTVEPAPAIKPAATPTEPTTAKTAEPTANKNAGVGFNASNVMKMPGMEKYAKQPSWADPKSKDYVGRREVTRRQQAQTTAKPATATGTNATPTTAPNPFGQMANTMRTYAPPETTSTGGTLTQTPTGQVHKASATNPNAASTQPAAPKVTKVTTGGPTPDKRAELDQRIQQLAQKPAPVQKESFTRDFGAMLWTKMRDSK